MQDMEGQPLRSWKNKRKKSLYTEEAGRGFIFRKLPRVEIEDQQPVAQPQSPQTQPLSEKETEHRDEERGAAENSKEQVPLDESMETDVTEEGLEDEDIVRDVELKRFISQLRKELLASGIEGSESELSAALELVAKDLKESGLYYKYLDASDTSDLPPNPLTQQLQENIAALKVSIKTYQREQREWDEVLEGKRREVEQDKRDRESERAVDFLALRPEDAAALQSYLTPQQQTLLQQVEGGGAASLQESSQQLQAIHSTIDKELERVQNYCQCVASKLGSENPEMSVLEETPRTLIRALKDF